MRRDGTQRRVPAFPKWLSRAGSARWIMALVALAVALVTATPLVAAAQTAAPGPLPSTRVDWGRTDLGQLDLAYRRLHRHELYGPTANTNVAVFEYEHDGEVFTITAASVSNFNKKDADGNVVRPTAIFDIRNHKGELVSSERVQDFTNPKVKEYSKNATVTSKHSELLIFLRLVDMGVDPATVTRIYSELEPCDLPRKHCVKKVAQRHPTATVTHSFEYGVGQATENERAASRKRGLATLKRAVEQYHAGLDHGRAAAQKLFSAAGDNSASGPLISLLAGGEPPPGGIDFTSLQLRYIADAGADGDAGLTYSLASGPSSEAFQADQTLDAARQASDSFFVWLSLSPSKFWVNLSPDEPDRIIDEQLGRTDAGRVLLEADLELKKTVARLIHPDSKVGRKFWDRLESNDSEAVCLSFRQWIVPEPAVVRDDGASLTILDAPLDVKLESEYIEAVGGTGRSYCPTSQRAAEAHNEAVFRQMILPRVRTAVNRAPAYADLRRVYTSRVAAEWYRNRSVAEDTAYGDLVDSEDISGWVLTGQWSPRKVFDSYVDSYTNGEFNVTRRSTAGSMIYEHTYVFGGVDFSRVPFREVSVDYMQREQAGLPETIERSITRAAADGSDQRWLGAVTNAAPPAGGFQPRDVTRLVRSDGFRIARWPLAVGVLVVLAVVLRRRGIRI